MATNRSARVPARRASRRVMSRTRAAQGSSAPTTRARGARVVRLGSELTIAHIAATDRAVRKLLGRGALTLDARAVGNVDSAGLQWLLVAGEAARQCGQRLRLTGGTALLQSAAAALGLGAQLAANVELCE